MSKVKVRKGATIVLKLDDLYIWIRSKAKEEDQRRRDLKRGIRRRSEINKRLPTSSVKRKGSTSANTSPLKGAAGDVQSFDLLNRPMDFKSLPPCRAKIVYMGHPNFLKKKKLMFGLQLYPPYFGQSIPVIKHISSKQVLGKLARKEVRAPVGSIWFVSEEEIKGVMLRQNPVGSTGSHSRKSSLSSIPANLAGFGDKTGDSGNASQSTGQSNPFSSAYSGRLDPRSAGAHSRRQPSAFSMSTHYRNMSSIANMHNVADLFWEDTNLPSTYDMNDSIGVSTQSDEVSRRFGLEQWLKPIFLDPTDSRTVEIVYDRANWELQDWLRTQKMNARGEKMRDFTAYLFTIVEQQDQLNMTIDTYEEETKQDSQHSSPRHNAIAIDVGSEEEKFKPGSLARKFEMLVRIKMLADAVQEQNAAFTLNLLDVFDNDLFVAAPVCKKLLPYTGNDFKFMVELRRSDLDAGIQMRVMQSIDRFNQYYSSLPTMWRLINTLDGQEEIVEKVFLLTNNGKEEDLQQLAAGVLEAVDDKLDLAIPIFEALTRSRQDQEESDEYITNHILKVLQLSQKDRSDRTMVPMVMIKYALKHPLISPQELFSLWKQNRKKTAIYRLNLLSAKQCTYEQYQLFLGRYLFYVPTGSSQTAQHESKQSDSDDDEERLLIEITLDIDNVSVRTGSYAKKMTIKRCRALVNNESEYEANHYYDNEVVKTWDISNYEDKILKLNDTKFVWIPNLESNNRHLEKISVGNRGENDNYLRGYLLFAGGKKNWRQWEYMLESLGDKSNTKEHKSLLTEMERRPLFMCAERWNLLDCNQ